MSPRKCSLFFLAATLCAQSDFGTTLSQYQAQLQSGTPTPEQIIRNLGSLSAGLRNGNWSNSNQRLQACQGTLGYLNSLRGNRAFTAHRNLGLSMSGLYRDLGGWMDPQDAWLSYRGSWVILNQLQSQYPQDQQIAGDLGLTRRGIEQVQAKLPDLPKLDWAGLDPVAQRDFDEIMERFISVSASVSSAEATAESMRRSLAAQGLAPRPEVVGGLTRMKLKFEDSRRFIEQRRFSQARERLDSADAEAKKILKSLGG